MVAVVMVVSGPGAAVVVFVIVKVGNDLSVGASADGNKPDKNKKDHDTSIEVASVASVEKFDSVALASIDGLACSIVPVL